MFLWIKVESGCYLRGCNRKGSQLLTTAEILYFILAGGCSQICKYVFVDTIDWQIYDAVPWPQTLLFTIRLSACKILLHILLHFVDIQCISRRDRLKEWPKQRFIGASKIPPHEKGTSGRQEKKCMIPAQVELHLRDKANMCESWNPCIYNTLKN